MIEVCVGTSCYVLEAQSILDKVCELTNCEPNSTTKNGKFSVVVGRCLGKCEHSPNVIINHKVYNNVTLEQVEELVGGLK